jgi:hypothetical protein
VLPGYTFQAGGQVTGPITFLNGTALTDTASGKLLLTGTTPMVLFGGSTSSFPAIKRNALRLQARLADDSDYAAVDALSLSSNGGGVWMASTSANDAFYMGGAAIRLFASIAPTTPTSCGTSPAIAANNGTVVMQVTGGTGGTATGCTIPMPYTATTGWYCEATNVTQTAAHRADRDTRFVSSTTTSATFEYVAVSTGAATAFTASDSFRAMCFSY